MAEAATRLPINTEATPATQPAKAADWQPFEVLRNQVDRLFMISRLVFCRLHFFVRFPT